MAESVAPRLAVERRISKPTRRSVSADKQGMSPNRSKVPDESVTRVSFGAGCMVGCLHPWWFAYGSGADVSWRCADGSTSRCHAEPSSAGLHEDHGSGACGPV